MLEKQVLLLFNIVNQAFLQCPLSVWKPIKPFICQLFPSKAKKKKNQQENKKQFRCIWHFKTGVKKKKEVTEIGWDEVTETGMTEVVCKRNTDLLLNSTDCDQSAKNSFSEDAKGATKPLLKQWSALKCSKSFTRTKHLFILVNKVFVTDIKLPAIIGMRTHK